MNPRQKGGYAIVGGFVCVAAGVFAIFFVIWQVNERPVIADITPPYLIGFTMGIVIGIVLVMYGKTLRSGG